MSTNTDLHVTTCTVGPNAVTGERCGQPAVLNFPGSDGVVYAECVEHAVAGFTSTIERDSKVVVRHAGVDKVGTVLAVTPTKVTVWVFNRDGRGKAITRPITEVTPA